ncbi:hypothetical protein [Sphingomonas sp.]|uniref:hypothetical protein n=1 Tax=Sphingomonas sp. TaxID=28214 RepID=UPI00257AAC81|nr:hypothetical protein [Sphingomonas sp.]
MSRYDITHRDGRERAEAGFETDRLSGLGLLAWWAFILLCSFGIWFAIIVQVVS